MRKLFATVCLGCTIGCGTVWVKEPTSGPYARMTAPVLPEAALSGPIVERSRVAGWNTFNYGSAALAVAGNRYGYAGAAASSSASGMSVAFEHYQSADVQEFLQKLLEDTGTVTRIFPSTEWQIKGTGGVSSLACSACVAFDLLTQFTLVAFVGVPLISVREATVELRVYHDHEFIRSYVGHGKCGAFGTVYWALWNGYTLENNGGGFGACASAAAVADSVRMLQEDPPRIDEAKN